MAKAHKLKLDKRYYEFVAMGVKNAEVRFNDRDFRTGDYLVLEEWTGKDYTGRFEVRQITGVFELDDIGFVGYVLLSLK